MLQLKSFAQFNETLCETSRNQHELSDNQINLTKPQQGVREIERSNT